MNQDPNKMTVEELQKAQEEGHFVVIIKGVVKWEKDCK